MVCACGARSEKLDRMFPGTRERPSPWGWEFWMFDKALLAEAEALIEGKR